MQLWVIEINMIKVGVIYKVINYIIIQARAFTNPELFECNG